MYWYSISLAFEALWGKLLLLQESVTKKYDAGVQNSITLLWFGYGIGLNIVW